jgi:predicted homoserine dehydrogenase-like protein
MIIIDTYLRRRQEAGQPIRVGIAGAGFMAAAVAYQISNATPGMKVAAIANRRVEKAKEIYREAGIEEVREARSCSALDDAIRSGQPAVCEDAGQLCASAQLDAIMEFTGSVEFGAKTALQAINNGKHFFTNAELDATLGPILNVYAQRAGVVYSSIDGDQPGTQMNLYRFVSGLGLEPLLCGNIKALQDAYRTPATQAGFAAKWGLSPHMATQFADGTKISMEQASVANATGMRVAKRGMLGYAHEGHVDELTKMYDVEELRRWGGIVDYVLGAKPSPGVFVLAAAGDSRQRRRLNLYKLGEGPLYSFYALYHLCHFEAPSAVARAVAFNDAVVCPKAGPSVEVIATAKRNLKAGEVLDGIGFYCAYGQCENAGIADSQDLLPMGLAEGCTLLCDIPKDQALRYSDVSLPEGSLAHRLKAEQNAAFRPLASAALAQATAPVA